MKVLHVITDLGQGGAEAVLCRLITASPADITHKVISLKSDGYYGPRLRARGIEVHALGLHQSGGMASKVSWLRRLIAATRPDMVQTWMYHGDLVGGLAARWAGVRRVVWGIRNSSPGVREIGASARAAAWACARLSKRIPAAIACCSVQAARTHQAIGYREEKFTVIPNGYDLRIFAPDAEARARLRKEWGIAEDETLLGMVARWDRQKDHGNLLRALARLRECDLRFRCVLTGSGMEPGNRELAGRIRGLGLEERMLLVGARDDIPAVMNALDLHLLSSVGEAFPNTVAEAMACGTPCVATDAGDAALIVGDTGWVVPRRDPQALAHGIADALQALAAQGRAEPGRRCRERIEAHFSLERMVNSYQALWMNVCETVSA